MEQTSLAAIFPGADFAPVNESLFTEARSHLDSLTKPQGSLGELERAAMRLYAIGNGREPIRVDPVILYTVAGDHGIAARNVSPFPQAVTRQMAANILDGGAGISVLCRVNRITQKLVDAGCAGGSFPRHAMLVDRRMGDGTKDMSEGPAMDISGCVAALRAGHALGEQAAQNGFACIATGELGIANSTAASALYCAFLGLQPDEAAGPGSGAKPPMVAHKAQMIAKALRANASAIASRDPVRILAALGGYEIAVLAGLMLSCASQRLPLVVDGFICASAYAAAAALYPPLAGYTFFAHASAEPGFARVLAKLNLPQRPLLDLGMRLGEGTGAALAIPILRAAAAIFNEMATLASAKVSATPEDRLD